MAIEAATRTLLIQGLALTAGAAIGQAAFGEGIGAGAIAAFAALLAGWVAIALHYGIDS